MQEVLSIPCEGVDFGIVEGYLYKLRAYIETSDYAGYDPYDALNSPFIRMVSSRSKWLKIACTQFLRRSPLNLRAILATQKGHNPKAIGLFLWGYTRLYALWGKPEYRPTIEYLLDLLEKTRSEGWSGNCWGYNFDWQNRTMWTPKYTPTIVNSAFIGHALLDTYFLAGVDRALDMAIGIRDFICNDLSRYEEQDRLCFSYTPRDDNYVHNANLLGASLLIRLCPMCEDRTLEKLALASLRYALRYQRADGAWYYGQMNLMRYVDSFHTGFNLQALLYFIREGYDALCQAPYDRGLRYYVENFFLSDGTAKYYDHKIFPVDIHSLCQAVVLLSDPLAVEQSELLERVLTWMLKYMWSPRGYFYYRKGRFHTNKICYMRWSQAWAFHALTSYLHNKTLEGVASPAQEACS
ncbi:MAG: hypothetical protein JXM79_02405 [Sedimentisphaerales bacterium]|nr:hypothetical protein [Sedimentisphaerales bacterium]